MNTLLFPIFVPIIVGLVIYFIPGKVKFIKQLLTLLTSTFVLGTSIWFFIDTPPQMIINNTLVLNVDNLSKFIFLAIGAFSFLVSIYSLRYMQDKPKLSLYYGSLLWTVGSACGVVFSNHLVLLLIFWGFLGLTLYLMILSGKEDSAPAAQKALVIIGGSDALILLAIAFIYFLTHTFKMDQISINLQHEGALANIAFILLALGVFAKIGAAPLHTWIPDVAVKAPLSVSAFLPGALDKLLGIYLLAKISLELFQLSSAMNLVLLIIGSLTIIISVMMALIQRDAKRMIGYLVITGAGYMILGFGTGNTIGIAGGLFYMINSALWTQCLFLIVGNVEKKFDSTELSSLGGLIKIMPLTFIMALIATLAISGIPPLNGFASKWMIYQGLVKLGIAGNNLWILWLIIAMLGSALTLASLMKLIHTVFLGLPSTKIKENKPSEVGFSLIFPPSVLAIICVIFGIFPFVVPIKTFIQPIIPGIDYIGLWSSDLATILILVGLAIGAVIYLYGRVFSNIREQEHFIGGEKLEIEERVTGTGFYNTIKEFSILKKIYKQAEMKVYDIYDQLLRLSGLIAETFRKVHTGVLTLYYSWVVVALIILLIILMGR